MELPEWIPKEAWDGWVAMRKEQKKALTERAKKMAIRRLAELRNQGWDPGMVLEQSEFCCWKGLFPLKEQGNGARQ